MLLDVWEANANQDIYILIRLTFTRIQRGNYDTIVNIYGMSVLFIWVHVGMTRS